MFLHVRFYVIFMGVPSATKVLLVCNTDTHLQALGKYGQLHQALWAMSKRKKS